MVPQSRPTRGTRHRLALVCCALANACVIVACGSNPQTRPQRFETSDFRAEPPLTAPERQPQQSIAQLPDENRSGTGSTLTIDTPQPLRSPDPVTSGATSLIGAPEPVILDAMVGQINGEPVYATDILNELEGRLLAAAEEYEPESWLRAATLLVYEELKTLAENELVLAEARSALTPEQQQGLLFFLERIRENIVSTGGGSQVAVDEELRDSTGMTLDQAAQDQLEREIIANEFRQQIIPRVQVSWRQVQRTHELIQEQFTPESTARLRLIRVAADDETARAQVESRLLSEPFETVATSELNQFQRGNGGLIESTFEGEYADAQLLAAGLNEIAQALTPGETRGAIDVGRSAWWIHLESLDIPRAPSLYDTQLDLFDRLENQRFSRELERYKEELLEQGSFTDLRKMTERIVIIAAKRYLPPGSLE